MILEYPLDKETKTAMHLSAKGLSSSTKREPDAAWLQRTRAAEVILRHSETQVNDFQSRFKFGIGVRGFEPEHQRVADTGGPTLSDVS